MSDFFLSENFYFLVVTISVYLNRLVFGMLLLISPSFGASGGLRFVMVAFPGNLQTFVTVPTSIPLSARQDSCRTNNGPI